MKAYWRSAWVRAGIAVFALGCGPLLLISALAALNLWPDPDPNPIGPGLLFVFSFWPAMLLLVVGIIRVRWQQGAGS